MDIFLPHISLESLHHYIRTMTRSMAVRSHRDMLEWLQGDIQSYLPHQIMIAAWGDFETGTVQHDILSRLVGVRSNNSNHITITPMLLKLFKRWVEFGHRPYAIHGDESSFLIPDSGRECKISEALRNMRCVMVHGIYDERGCHDCVYAIFRNIVPFSLQEHDTMALMLPYVDTALRQVEHLPHQVRGASVANIVSESTDSSVAPGNDLTDRDHYIRTMTRSMAVRSHRDVLEWLQGDIQSYLPHQIMIAAWGDFETGIVQHDILSRLAGVRSNNSNHTTITPMLLKLFKRWVEFGHRPYAIHGDESSFLITDSGRECKISEALRNMPCVMVHGIYDERGCHDCVYAIFRMNSTCTIQKSKSMRVVFAKFNFHSNILGYGMN